MVLFVDFAVGHANKYSLDLRVPNVSESTVSTWHVDQLIKDYKASREVCVFIQEQL
jgi:hypothetical protein